MHIAGELGMTSTRIEDNGLTLVLDRTIDAPRSAVWRCWTEPELLRQWYCPAPWTVPEADFDLRPGGRMNCTMQGPEGERVEVSGIWLEIVPEERLAFTDAFTEGFIPQPESFMTGFVRLSDNGDGTTHLIWGARHTSKADVEKHLEMGFRDGWTAASAQLADVARALGTQPA
tara:strand:- start:2183 stop:2701 length:519 start_codon:yes stop_codon:yes gene_type:complete